MPPKTSNKASSKKITKSSGKTAGKSPRKAKAEVEASDASKLVSTNDNNSSEADCDGNLELEDDGLERTAAGYLRINGLSMNPKAIKAREKSDVSKFEVVKRRLQTGLDRDDGVVIDCHFYADNKRAPMDEHYDYTHLMKLQSSLPFALVKQTMLSEGPYKGHVAIIVKQSIPFPFLKLPIQVRVKVYNYLLSETTKTIAMTLKHGGTKIAYSPTYMSKNNLKIMAACRQLRDEGAQVVYGGHTFHFPGTQVVQHFLLQIESMAKYIKSIHSDSYTSTTASLMFKSFVHCRALERVSFAHVSSNERPPAAIKTIFNDANPWFLDVGRSDPAKGLDILSFDDAAFHFREKTGNGGFNVIKWGQGHQLEFLKGLRAKLEAAVRRT